MDVTRPPLAGTMPLRNRRPLPGATSLVAAPGSVATGGGTLAARTTSSLQATAGMVELRGQQDGDIMLASGVRIRKRRFGAHRVSPAELQQAMTAIQQLPWQDQLTLARTGIPVELLPVAQLEQVPGLDASRPVLGATAISSKADGRTVPTQLRVAVRSPLSTPGSPNAIGEIVQHEIGHVLSVLRTQDTSEAAAERYAAAY